MQPVQFFFLYKGIHREVNLFPEQMSHMEPGQNFILCKIVRVGSGPVKLSAQINGVRAGIYGPFKSLEISGRR